MHRRRMGTEAKAKVVASQKSQLNDMVFTQWMISEGICQRRYILRERKAPPRRHQLRRIFPVCITALSAVSVYCTAVSFFLYNCQEPTVQLNRQGKILYYENAKKTSSGISGTHALSIKIICSPRKSHETIPLIQEQQTPGTSCNNCSAVFFQPFCYHIL